MVTICSRTCCCSFICHQDHCELYSCVETGLNRNVHVAPFRPCRPTYFHPEQRHTDTGYGYGPELEHSRVPSLISESFVSHGVCGESGIRAAEVVPCAMQEWDRSVVGKPGGKAEVKPRTGLHPPQEGVVSL